MTFDATLATQRKMVAALQNPTCYPHPVGTISVIETHISFVLLTGVFAYKIKKALDLGFVDYSSLGKRHFFCCEELRLNRRLAAQIYLDVVTICGTVENPRVDGGEEPIEYAVKMTEFDQQDLLSLALAQDCLTVQQLNSLATTLAAFHKTIPPVNPAEPYGSPAVILAALEANFVYFHTHSCGNHALLAALESWCRNKYDRLRIAFSQRKATGWVRECHGDLHLGNIVLSRGVPLVFDCIEFNAELRWIDVISDLAFVIMDLSAQQRPDYAWHLLNTWLEEVGDYAGLALLCFYQVYRALVRAKVAHLRSIDEAISPQERQAAWSSATVYLNYATTLIAPVPCALLITHGFSGSGKSTLSRSIAAPLHAICLHSDVERKRLHGLSQHENSRSGIGTGIYTRSATIATYEHLAILAHTVIQAGYPVIIDAACLLRDQRDCFREVAQHAGVPLLILDCHAPEAILQQRMATRHKEGNDPSEATPAVFAQQFKGAEPLSPEEQKTTLTINTVNDDPADILAKIRWRLRTETT